MRFDPKLIHPEEAPLAADGELELPADLAALAEQLGDDAAHLAASFPAARTERNVTTRRVGQSSARSYWRYALVGSSLAALLLAVAVWQMQPGQPVVNRTTVATSPLPIHTPALASPTAVDAVSLADLSAPELEALLDMLDRDPNRVTSISF
jgi:hypothetical protein